MPQEFDPRYNNLALTLTYPAYGNLAGSRTLTMSVRNGEGQVWLDTGVTPTIGTITQGMLTLASETFPRFAPLTLTLTGADLCFLVRNGQLVHFALVDGAETLLRLYCTSLWTAAYSYQLDWPTVPSPQDRLVLTRLNGADIDGLTKQPRASAMELYRLKGTIQGQPGASRRFPNSDVVRSDKVVLARASDGELVLQLHGGRMEWDFAGGVLTALRAFGSSGPVANTRVLGIDAGASISVAFLDTVV
jgi:hypothetical protein